MDDTNILTGAERRILEALAATAIPAGRFLPEGGAAAAGRLTRFLAARPRVIRRAIRGLLWAVELGALVRHGRPFSRLGPARRLSYLESWRQGGMARRTLLRVLLVTVKVSHFSDPELFAALGCEYTPEPITESPPRWMQQVRDAASLARDEEVEAEVVVVGTGAGGAVVARELAEQGHAVVMLEEGPFFTRKDFTGTRAEQSGKLYRDFGFTPTLGNVPIVVPVGRGVGGTTTINSGTCFRIPDWILADWRDRLGLSGLTEQSLEPYYQRVEATLGVAEAKPEVLGGMARVIARGGDALGWRHGPLLRNAPDCEGRGLCCFGCPTGAKRSTDVSYVPLALRRGAVLFTSARACQVLTDESPAGVRRARGVLARCQRPGGPPRTLTVRAKVVVIACGTLHTPLLLRGSLGDRSPALGRNLSLHPATSVLALFDEEIRGWDGIPQGYAVYEHHREGVLFEGSFSPLDYVTLSIPIIGPRFTEIVESYGQLANFGFMIHDSSRGRVLPGPAGRPLMLYNLNETDRRLLHRALGWMCELYLAAGARRIFPLVHGFDELADARDLERLRRARLPARSFDLMAFHPLGTARLGVDPAGSVLAPDHEAHAVQNLFVVDGSAVPTSLAVNPQVAIMTLATRAAGFIDGRLNRLG